MFTIEQRERVKQAVQEHPFAIKTVAGIVSALGVIVGATLAIDSRYAKAADLKDVTKNQVEQTRVLKDMQTQNTLLYLDMLERDKRTLEREMIIIQRKQNKTEEDKESLDYTKERLKEIDGKRDRLQRSLGVQ